MQVEASSAGFDALQTAVKRDLAIAPGAYWTTRFFFDKYRVTGSGESATLSKLRSKWAWAGTRNLQAQEDLFQTKLKRHTALKAGCNPHSIPVSSVFGAVRDRRSLSQPLVEMHVCVGSKLDNSGRG